MFLMWNVVLKNNYMYIHAKKPVLSFGSIKSLAPNIKYHQK